MKQEVSPTATTTSTTATKPQGNPRAATSSRLRASSKPKDSHTLIRNNNNGNRVSPPLLPKPTPNSKPVLANKPKPRSGVEQFSRPTRRQNTPDLKNSDLGGKKELDEKVDQEKRKSETLIRDLQTEVLELKADLDKAQRLNEELQLCNRKLSEELAAAEAKLASTLITPPQQTTPTFKDIQKLIATKLDHSKVTNESTSDARPTTRALMAPDIQSVPVASADLQRKVAACHLLPPPPPPPLPRATLKGAIIPKAPLIPPSGSRNHDKPVVMSAHSNLVGEIQKRSTHLLAIKTDIETKGEFVNSLIQKVLDAAYSDIEDVLQFVDWLDDQLLSLADERAVLKHFKWPEKKADAMREAAVEYRGLKLLQSELSSHKDDPTIPCAVTFKKMAGLLDKSEKSIHRLIKLRTFVMLSYQQFKIPIDWMLDSGFISKIKQGSMMLAKIYLRRVTTELESAQYLERESTQEGLLLQGIHFAYKVHQFAGGLDSQTLCAFEEIRRRVPGHLRESQALLTGIP
ncbi:protein CHUP1, chloroplastic [Rhododendron vialii]|uniref:protein CHUP1, chloroplastic n=1 Tax=Rhododendron vialii TaxID=182163 RepID=UPI00265F52AF|nr:protein CHUP1, chloroplastic [Rhododendron vialii]